MKTCSKCLEPKLNSDYYVKDSRSGRLHAQCKQCYKAHRKTYYALHYDTYKEEYRERARQYRKRLRDEYRQGMRNFLKGKCCVDCGETDTVTLELDHVEPSQKLFSISQAVKLGYSWQDTLKEMDKCQIVCANCHKRRTAKQFQRYKLK